MRDHCIYSSLPAFRPSAKLVPPTMPSADFCAAVRPPYDALSPESGTQRRPPEVRSTAFTARPPNLPPRSLMTADFAITCSLVRPGRPLYPVLVHRAAALLHASFRPHLAMTPLRFANPSPPSGWIGDLHPMNHRTCTAHNDGLWKAWENDKTVFPPFPQTLEIAPRFPHSLRPAADNLYPISNQKEPSSTALFPSPSGSSFNWKRLRVRGFLW